MLFIRLAAFPTENLIPLSFEEHRDLGHEIKATMAKLRVLRDVVVGVYGPANRAAFSFEKAMELMEHLQQDLATQAAWDLPGYPSNQLYFEGVPPAFQQKAGSVIMARPTQETAYSSAPPLLTSMPAAMEIALTESALAAVTAPAEEPNAQPIAEESLPGYGSTD